MRHPGGGQESPARRIVYPQNQTTRAAGRAARGRRAARQPRMSASTSSRIEAMVAASSPSTLSR
ncbi:hypothetical protein, partial [Agromyces sp. H66]|uniref:hypothetical protein n=1 Tax=Agromyces sp. H66 TaxID=2529859 RepID=UPI001B7D8C5A